MTKKTHPTIARGWYGGSPEDMGRAIMRLRYDAALAVVYGMVLEAYDQMQHYAARGNKKFARRLYGVYISLAAARKALQLVWVICRLHMKKELSKIPEIKSGQIHGY